MWSCKEFYFFGFYFFIFKINIYSAEAKRKGKQETTRSNCLGSPAFSCDLNAFIRVGSGRVPHHCQSYGSDLLLRRLGPTCQSESKSSSTLINKARQRLHVTNLPPESHEQCLGAHTFFFFYLNIVWEHTHTQKKKKKKKKITIIFAANYEG